MGFNGMIMEYTMNYSWLVVWNMTCIFPYISGIIIPIDAYFSEGWLNNQPVKRGMSRVSTFYGDIVLMIGRSWNIDMGSISYYNISYIYIQYDYI